MFDLKGVVNEARDLLSGEDRAEYREGVLDLAAGLAFPQVPLAVGVELMKTALAEYDKGEW